MFAAAASMICVWAGQANQRAALGGSGVREWESYAKPGCVCLVFGWQRRKIYCFCFCVCVSGFVIFGF